MRITVDASAVLAVLLEEPDADLYGTKIFEATEAWISPVNWWEVHAKLRAEFGEAGSARAASWLHGVGMRIEPITWEQTQEAIAARARYAGSPARLNLGDCFAYALARTKGIPLLYKGGDFTHTDVRAA